MVFFYNFTNFYCSSILSLFIPNFVYSTHTLFLFCILSPKIYLFIERAFDFVDTIFSFFSI